MFKCGNVSVCGNWQDELTTSQADHISGLSGNLLGGQSPGKAGMKTLVISLEALIFNTLQPLDDADFIINVEVDEIVYQVHVKKRPGIEEFLNKVAENYEVIIWTSRAQYVNSCIDQIDTHSVVSARLFREHCKRQGPEVVKDISLIGRPLKKTILIDDDETNYMNLPKNSIALKPWKGDSEDSALLMEVLPKLDDLVLEKDVRKVLDANLADNADE